MNSTINKMKASKDPKMIQMYDLTMQRFNQYKEDPDELAKRVAAALSAEYSKTQWENKK